MLSLSSLLKMQSPWSQDSGAFWDYNISQEVIQSLITATNKRVCSAPVLCAITQLLSECEKISQFCGFSTISRLFWSKFYFRLHAVFFFIICLFYFVFLADDKFCSQTEKRSTMPQFHHRPLLVTCCYSLSGMTALRLITWWGLYHNSKHNAHINRAIVK